VDTDAVGACGECDAGFALEQVSAVAREPRLRNVRRVAHDDIYEAFEPRSCERTEEIALVNFDPIGDTVKCCVTPRDRHCLVGQVARPDATAVNLTRNRTREIAAAAAHIDRDARGHRTICEYGDRTPCKVLGLPAWHQNARCNMHF
jgi:hypothetical protein